MTVTDARKVLDAAMPEADFQQQVIELAEICGWWVYHVHDSRRSNPGFPDLMVVRGATLRFLEVKSEKGRTRPEQEAVIALLQQVRNVYADIVRPHDWPDIEAVLRSKVR